MASFGFTLNNFTLFGLVLAVGIVVDDAIVVVENVERNIAAGLNPREAAIRSIDEVGTALIAIALVLCAVFIPSRSSPEFQGSSIASSRSPSRARRSCRARCRSHCRRRCARCCCKPHDPKHRDRWSEVRSTASSASSISASTSFPRATASIVGKVVRIAVIMLVAYAAVIAYGLNESRQNADRIYLAARSRHHHRGGELPPGAALARTDAVMRRAFDIAPENPTIFMPLETPGTSKQ